MANPPFPLKSISKDRIQTKNIHSIQKVYILEIHPSCCNAVANDTRNIMRHKGPNFFFFCAVTKEAIYFLGVHIFVTKVDDVLVGMDCCMTDKCCL